MDWQNLQRQVINGIVTSVVVVVLISAIYGPFVLSYFLGDKFQIASAFLGNLVGISALTLSIVAIWITLMGMQWQHDLELKIESMINSVQRIESKQDSMSIPRKSVARRTIKKKQQDYAEESK